MDYTAILILACIFIPLERLLPLHEHQPILRRNWFNDLIYLLFNGFVVRAGSFVILGSLMAGWQWMVPEAATQGVRALPLWVQTLGVILVADIGYYTAHRLAHTIPFLWKFHAVHHSVEDMDWLATHRVHPMDQIFTNALSLLPVFFLGFSAPAVAIYAGIYHAHALLLHANVRMNFGPLKWLIASPEYHHWHHADQREAYNRNFASQLSVIDLIAGTMFLPQDRRPDRYGVSDPVPQTYPQQLLYPFTSNIAMYRKRMAEKGNEMKIPSEDRLGMAALLIVFGYLLMTSLHQLAGLFAARDTIELWGLVIASRVTSLMFLGLIVWFTATRLPARNTVQGVAPRVVAIAGTFVMMLVAVVPVAEIGPIQRIASTLILVAGTVLSVICLFKLGRSFAVAPAARALVTTGPYGIVRHPLYAAELITIVGVVLSVGSAAALMLGGMWLLLQIARARFEEKVLSEAFPEYADYARKVPMIIPGLYRILPPREAEQQTVGG